VEVINPPVKVYLHWLLIYKATVHEDKPVRLRLSAKSVSQLTIFFSYKKNQSAVLSAGQISPSEHAFVQVVLKLTPTKKIEYFQWRFKHPPIKDKR
jgi:hypothetical protein